MPTRSRSARRCRSARAGRRCRRRAAPTHPRRDGRILRAPAGRTLRAASRDRLLAVVRRRLQSRGGPPPCRRRATLRATRRTRGSGALLRRRPRPRPHAHSRRGPPTASGRSPPVLRLCHGRRPPGRLRPRHQEQDVRRRPVPACAAERSARRVAASRGRRLPALNARLGLGLPALRRLRSELRPPRRAQEGRALRHLLLAWAAESLDILGRRARRWECWQTRRSGPTRSRAARARGTVSVRAPLLGHPLARSRSPQHRRPSVQTASSAPSCGARRPSPR